MDGYHALVVFVAMAVLLTQTEARYTRKRVRSGRLALRGENSLRINLRECGRADVGASRVISGHDATLGEWPWQVGLYLQQREFTCGGSLITPGWVLTAAHCIFEGEGTYKVRLGDLNRLKSDNTEQMIDVVKVIKHHMYGSPVPNTNDVALLKLERDAVKTPFVNTVCLPGFLDHVTPGTRCFITGWGRTSVPGDSSIMLQQAELEVVSNKDCHEQHETSRIKESTNGTYEITPAMVCARDTTDTGRSGCHGDSGGPFVCPNAAGQWVLQGVVSWGDYECKTEHHYSVFARVSALRDWIDDVISSN